MKPGSRAAQTTVDGRPTRGPLQWLSRSSRSDLVICSISGDAAALPSSQACFFPSGCVLAAGYMWAQCASRKIFLGPGRYPLAIALMVVLIAVFLKLWLTKTALNENN